MFNPNFIKLTSKYLRDKYFINLKKINKKTFNIKYERHFKRYYNWDKIKNIDYKKFLIKKISIKNKNQYEEFKLKYENLNDEEKSNIFAHVLFSTYCYSFKINFKNESFSSLKINSSYDHIESGKDLPKSLKILRLGKNFNKKISLESLQFLKILSFGENFNQTLIAGCLPNSLLKITFGDNFNQPLNNILPNSLISIEFGKFFNQPLYENTFPLSIKHIKFGENFNQPLIGFEKLLNLKCIEFGNSFNRPINSLPINIRKIKLGSKFNHSIDNMIDRCTSIIIGDFDLIRNLSNVWSKIVISQRKKQQTNADHVS